MAEPKFTGAGRRHEAPELAPRQKASDEQLAARALATQAKPQTLAPLLSPEQRRALIATLDDNGLATEATPAAVRRVLSEFYGDQKAVVDADDEAEGD